MSVLKSAMGTGLEIYTEDRQRDEGETWFFNTVKMKKKGAWQILKPPNPLLIGARDET